MFDMLSAATTDEPAAVTDAAEMLRRFNAPGGITHTSATASPNEPPLTLRRSHPTRL
jgi:hypothetical protein